MKHFAFIIAFIFNFTALKSQQNLVPNWSFEDTLNCGTTFYPNMICSPWFNPSAGSPDYFTPYYLLGCGTWLNDPLVGYQIPKTGEAYTGIFNWETNGQREYLEVKLLDTLCANKKYKCSLWFSQANACIYRTDRIGIYFSNDSLYDTSLTALAINVVPQIEWMPGQIIMDTLNWLKLEGYYLANGGEKFIAIGNFYTNNNTAVDSSNVSGTFYASYLFIDDVQLNLDTTTGLNENISSICTTAIYPNLVKRNYKNEISIISQCPILKVKIYEYSGKLIFERSNFNSSHKIIFEAPYFNKLGIYLISIISADGSAFKSKLVVH